jgi:glycosyltransferase involved in cell wall biosynthesis
MTSVGKPSPAFGKNSVDISVAVPVYKEETNIEPFLRRIVPILEQIGSYEILFCLDPSPDRTEEIIEEQIGKNQNLGLLVMSRRFGQPAATMAGILNCRGNACVVIATRCIHDIISVEHFRIHFGDDFWRVLEIDVDVAVGAGRIPWPRWGTPPKVQ